jgi:hypothetical protein
MVYTHWGFSFVFIAVVFQHIPFFIEDPTEEKEYFNLEKDFRIKMLDKLGNEGRL